MLTLANPTGGHPVRKILITLSSFYNLRLTAKLDSEMLLEPLDIQFQHVPYAAISDLRHQTDCSLLSTSVGFAPLTALPVSINSGYTDTLSTSQFIPALSSRQGGTECANANDLSSLSTCFGAGSTPGPFYYKSGKPDLETLLATRQDPRSIVSIDPSVSAAAALSFPFVPPPEPLQTVPVPAFQLAFPPFPANDHQTVAAQPQMHLPELLEHGLLRSASQHSAGKHKDSSLPPASRIAEKHKSAQGGNPLRVHRRSGVTKPKPSSKDSSSAQLIKRSSSLQRSGGPCIRCSIQHKGVRRHVLIDRSF